MSMRTIGGALALVCAPVGADAIVVFYDDRAAFEAATTGFIFTFDTFDNNIAAADSIIFDSNVVSTNIGGNRFPQDNQVEAGTYRNAVDGDGSSGSLLVTWTFPKPVTAVGFDYPLADPNAVTVTVNGFTRALLEVDAGPSEGFFGFVAPTLFQSIVFDTLNPTFVSGLFVENLQFGSAPAPDRAPAPIPVPAASLLLASALGLAGLVARGRRLRSGA